MKYKQIGITINEHSELEHKVFDCHSINEHSELESKKKLRNIRD
jgi:hypothetical protein